MMTLSKTRYRRAVDFLESGARPVERARRHRRLGDVDTGSVLEELKAYRNPDGGSRLFSPGVGTGHSSHDTRLGGLRSEGLGGVLTLRNLRTLESFGRIDS